MITAVPFREEHAKQLPVPGHLFEHAVTVLDGETVLGVVGAHKTDDVVEVWLALSDEAKSRPLALCRAARVFVKELLLEHGQIKACVTRKTDRRWAEHLGFVFDNDVGVLKA